MSNKPLLTDDQAKIIEMVNSRECETVAQLLAVGCKRSDIFELIHINKHIWVRNWAGILDVTFIGQKALKRYRWHAANDVASRGRT